MTRKPVSVKWHSRKRPQLLRGFTLVEVLVAIVILSIGILGAVGMQVSAIRMNKEVRYQAVAVTMAKELAEKMRGNKDLAILTTACGGTCGAGQNPYLLNATLTASTSLSAPSPNCSTATCTAQQMAVWDSYDWRLRMRDALPSPRIVVCMDTDPYDGAGQPEWACDNSGTVAVMKLAWNRAGTTGETEFTSNTATLPMLVLPLTAGSNE